MRGLLEPIFDEQVEVVTLIEDLALHIWVEFTQSPNFTILFRDQLLVESSYLDVKAVLGKIEIRSETLRGYSIAIPFDVERAGFVVPLDLIEVKQLRKLPFRIVREIGGLAWGKVCWIFAF